MKTATNILKTLDYVVYPQKLGTISDVCWSLHSWVMGIEDACRSHTQGELNKFSGFKFSWVQGELKKDKKA